METAIGQQAPQVQQLSEENKQKVCLIIDINKVYKVLSGGKILTTPLFDELYDAKLEDLHQALQHYQGTMYQQRVRA